MQMGSVTPVTASGDISCDTLRDRAHDMQEETAMKKLLVAAAVIIGVFAALGHRPHREREPRQQRGWKWDAW